MDLGSTNGGSTDQGEERRKRRRTDDEIQPACVDQVTATSTSPPAGAPTSTVSEPVPYASWEKTERLRRGVLDHLDYLFERPGFMGDLRKYFRIDCSTSADDPSGDPCKLKEWSKKVVNSLFDYRRDVCRLAADGRDLTLEMPFGGFGRKKSKGVQLFRKLVDTYKLPSTVPFKTSSQNARNRYLHSLDCFDISRACTSRFYASLLSNELLEQTGLFRDKHGNSKDRVLLLRDMRSDNDENHVLRFLGESPYALRDGTPTFETPPMKFVENIKQYRDAWTTMVSSQLRAQMHEFLNDGDPLSNGWLVQWHPQPWVKNMDFALGIDEVRGSYTGPLTVKLVRYGDNCVYFSGGPRALRVDDVVIVRFFCALRTARRLVYNYDRWANGCETGKEAEEMTFWAYVTSVPERHCTPTWSLEFYKPEGLEKSNIRGLAEVIPAANIYTSRCQLRDLRGVIDLSFPLQHTLVDPTKTPSSLVGEPRNGYGFETGHLLEYYKRQLNPSQYEMCLRAVNRFLYRIVLEDHHKRSGFVIVQGPPGTGKSTAITALVNLLVERPIRQKVLLCAPSNAAVDVLIERLLRGLVKVETDSGTIRLVRYTPMIVRLSSTTGTQKAMTVSIERLASQLVNPREVACTPRDQVHGLYHKEKVGLLETSKVQVICATLGSLGQSIVRNSNLGVSVVIVDEAGQCTEPELLSSLVCPTSEHSGPSMCVLVGDPMQLPPTIRYGPKGQCKDLERSLLQRLMENRMHAVGDVLCLDTQYRMHPAISYFARTQFYVGKLKDSSHVRCREEYCMPYHWDASGRFGPVTFIDTCRTKVYERKDGLSKFNRLERDIVAALLLVFQKVYDRNLVTRGCWGVLSPYRSQVKDIRETLDGHPILADMNVTCSTVDSMQGNEKELIILSTVRSNAGGRIGFLDDYRRFNVAFTRPRKSLIVIGNSETLRTDKEWSTFISHTKNRAPTDYRYITLPEGARVRKDLCPELLLQSEVSWWSRTNRPTKEQ